jgi:hypothetical protein
VLAIDMAPQVQADSSVDRAYLHAGSGGANAIIEARNRKAQWTDHTCAADSGGAEAIIEDHRTSGLLLLKGAVHIA